MRLEGRVSVVTGGGRGIGRAICLALAREGSDVVIASDVKSEVEAVAGEVAGIGRSALAYELDVTKPDQVEALAETTAARFRRLDVLVNNAGVVGKRAFLADSDDAVGRRTIEVNLFGTYHCTRAFLPAIIEQKAGRIINIASISGKQASPTNWAYCASKHAVIGLTRTVAAEMGLLGLVGITVNAVCPGVVSTDMVTGPGGVVDELARLLRISPEDVIEDRIKPLSIQRRLLEPEEIAGTVVHLASDAGRGITGQAINVCGGSVSH